MNPSVLNLLGRPEVLNHGGLTVFTPRGRWRAADLHVVLFGL